MESLKTLRFAHNLLILLCATIMLTAIRQIDVARSYDGAIEDIYLLDQSLREIESPEEFARFQAMALEQLTNESNLDQKLANGFSFRSYLAVTGAFDVETNTLLPHAKEYWPEIASLKMEAAKARLATLRQEGIDRSVEEEMDIPNLIPIKVRLLLILWPVVLLLILLYLSIHAVQVYRLPSLSDQALRDFPWIPLYPTVGFWWTLVSVLLLPLCVNWLLYTVRSTLGLFPLPPVVSFSLWLGTTVSGLLFFFKMRQLRALRNKDPNTGEVDHA